MAHQQVTVTSGGDKLPEFVKEAPSIAKHLFKVHIAIDFGTDGTSLAYGLPNDEKTVFVHQTWVSSKYNVDVKPNTIILLDENGQTLGFGKDAKHTYITSMNMNQKWMLFERFKMSLYENNELQEDNGDEKNNDKIGIKQELTAANGKKMKSSVVFIAAFKYLQKIAKDYLKRKRIKNIKNSDIQWIITVPAIWNDSAKYQMRIWMIEAGLVDVNIWEQCKIVYEPDCASLAIQHYIHKSKSQISNFTDDPIDNDQKQIENNEKMLIKGDKYILVDAGGGTVDIACHEILGENGDFGVKEVLHPSGGPWGSCYIDDQYIKLLKDIFGNKWIKEFKQTTPNFYTELTHNFQNAKKKLYKKQDFYNVKLPFEFIGFIQDKLEENNNENTEGIEDIEDIVSRSKVFGKEKLVELAGDYLRIHNNAWKIMFDYVVQPTVSHIKKLLKNPKLMRKNCKYLCLVGGLSTSSYFQAKMTKKFGPKSKYKLHIIIPPRPILAVVEGAAYFGITDNYIKARILQYTYGKAVSFPVSVAKQNDCVSEYISNNKFYDEYRKAWFVRGCFEVIARKNEEIYTGQIKKTSSERQSNKDKDITTSIMWSRMEYPKVKSDGDLLGTMGTIFDNEDKDDMTIITEFHFYDTLIKSVVYREKAPQDKQICYITKYK